MVIKIYHQKKKVMVSEMLKNIPIFQDNNIVVTDNIDECDIIIGNTNSFFKHYLRLGKHLLVWSNEPYWSTDQSNTIKLRKKKIHVMNCYTGDIYMDNFFYFFTIAHNPLGEHFYKSFVPKTVLRRKIVAIMTYDGNTKHSLRSSRATIALEGHSKGIIDIWGKGWPLGISKGNTRSTYAESKPMILKDYDFCFAFENSNIRYYVTEKIWHAICNFTLPIYYGNSWIYETFPSDSFIDYTKFSSNDELFEFVKNMSVEEYNERLSKCIDVVKNNIEYVSTTKRYEKTAIKLFEKIKQIKPF